MPRKKKVKPQYFGKKETKVFLKVSIALVLLLVIFVYFLVMGKSGYLVRHRMKKQMLVLEEEIKEVKKKIVKLKKEVTRLKKDSNYIEEQARELGMIREEEKIIEFIPSRK